MDNILLQFEPALGLYKVNIICLVCKNATENILELEIQQTQLFQNTNSTPQMFEGIRYSVI